MAEASSSNGPVPSKHIFIHQFSDQEPYTKVRFLSCVIEYDHKAGRLTVEHDYPQRSTGTSSSLRSPRDTKATVDINLILESTNLELLRPGSWINVIGYVQEKSVTGIQRESTGRRKISAELPEVQAVLVWSAGAVKVDEYEKTMEGHLAAMDARRQ